MEINQLQLNNLAVASDIGKVMGWVSGLACAYLPTWVVLGIGMSLGMVGYGVQWLILSGIIHPLDYWQVIFFNPTTMNLNKWNWSTGQLFLSFLQ